MESERPGESTGFAHVREAIINAFCHRDYRDPDEVRIAIYPDRVEVRNPGTLMEGVSLRALKSGKVSSRRRNPLIADLLRRIHLIEAWGRGIPLILEKAPDVRFTQVAGIFITEFPRPAANKETESGPESGPESIQQKVLTAVSRGPLSKSEIATRIGHKSISRKLNERVREMLELSLIEMTRPDKPNSRLQKYRLTEKGRRVKGEG